MHDNYNCLIYKMHITISKNKIIGKKGLQNTRAIKKNMIIVHILCTTVLYGI